MWKSNTKKTVAVLLKHLKSHLVSAVDNVVVASLLKQPLSSTALSLIDAHLKRLFRGILFMFLLEKDAETVAVCFPSMNSVCARPVRPCTAPTTSTNHRVRYPVHCLRGEARGKKNLHRTYGDRHYHISQIYSAVYTA